MNLMLDLDTLHVEDPFSSTPRHGSDVSWIVRDLEDEARPIGGQITHYDAMRVNLHGPGQIVMRVDSDPALAVTGRSFSSNHASSSPIDVTPALANLEMQDFVDLLYEDFGPGPVSERILGLLDAQGDPRAQRLFLYTTLWSTPDETGKRPEARLQVNQDQLMDWLEVRRPEIHEELSYRMSPPGPSIYD
jgi:hypothetical protein